MGALFSVACHAQQAGLCITVTNCDHFAVYPAAPGNVSVLNRHQQCSSLRVLAEALKPFGVRRRGTSGSAGDKENQPSHQQAYAAAAPLQEQRHHQQPFRTPVSIVGAVLPQPVSDAAAAARPQRPPVAGKATSSKANSHKSCLASSRVPEANMSKRQLDSKHQSVISDRKVIRQKLQRHDLAADKAAAAMQQQCAELQETVAKLEAELADCKQQLLRFQPHAAAAKKLESEGLGDLVTDLAHAVNKGKLSPHIVCLHPAVMASLVIARLQSWHRTSPEKRASYTA